MEALRLLSRSTGLRAQKSRPQEPSIPSQGQSSPPPANISRKRKRDDGSLQHQVSEKDLPNDEVRKVQQRHKIRIVNLRKVQKANREGSDKPRKRIKEEARLFPQPLTNFSQLISRYDITPALALNVADQGYYEPTEVQLASLPLLLDKDEKAPDLLTVAPTGSGKTLAFMLSLVEKVRRQHVLERESSDEQRRVRALILAPTKELVGQIVNEGRKLCNGTGVSITAMKKGMRLHDYTSGMQYDESSDEDEMQSRPPANQSIVKSAILVATPMSLLQAISRDDGKQVTLPHVETLILDEADVLLDGLFQEQSLSIWAALDSHHLRVSCWSATVGSNIEDLVLKIITERQQTLGIKKPPPIVRIVVGLKDSSLPTISHKLIYAATEQGKLLGLRQLLHPTRKAQSTDSTESVTLRPPFLVFTQTIDRATSLHQELQYDIPAAAGGPSRIAVLHSSLSSTARSDIMTKFRKGEIWIVITTDLLSRGVDFKGINGVVNYDIPTTSAAYVHRAGRTGRAGRVGGVCVTLYTKEDIKYLKAVVSVIQASQKNGNGSALTEKVDLGLDPWILNALPDLSKKDRRELKERGVETRRAIKESDNDKERRMKGKARIGTKSGYERQAEGRKKGAVEGSLRRQKKQSSHDEDDCDGEEEGADNWEGFD